MKTHAQRTGTDLLALANTAALEIAPLFALDRFVATNPFLGHAAQPFAEAARELSLTGATALVPSREAFRRALASGEIVEGDIVAALASHGLEASSGAAAAVRLALAAPAPDASAQLPTAAALLHRRGGTTWSGFVVDQLSRFCGNVAAGNVKPEPGALFATWRNEIDLDLSAAMAGLPGVDVHLRQLPRSVDAMLAEGHMVIGLPPKQFGLYLKRLLADVAGWAAFWRGREWDEDQHSAGAVLDLLAMRLGWDVALIAQISSLATKLRSGFSAAVTAATAESTSVIDAIMQDAFENSWRRALFRRLTAGGAEPAMATENTVHAVFCIDVRSEPLRRALEAQDPRISTGGFAGFFGLPLEVMGGDQETGAAHCPALIMPSLLAKSSSMPSPFPKGWNGLLEEVARSPLASLGFVETLGLAYAVKHVASAVAPVFGKSKSAALRIPAVYRIAHADGAPLDLGGRTDFAAAMLRGMGLTGAIAPVIVLVGHSAATRNNAHAASLNCGACGGHSGEASAVVAANLLNDPAVRKALAARGMVVPEGTVFVPALHETTSNAVTFLLDPSQPLSGSVQQAVDWLAAAGRVVAQPAHQTRLPGTGTSRSQDWSAVRPEWGLAGCAAFIAGPRHATRHVDLEGSVFLHSYDWRQDDGFALLEQILTAPLIVASWINLQYFAAMRDNDRFGGGNKLIHNVVAGIGVIEGAGGDLRPGLPLQSLHDGENFVHTPVRLTALVEAPDDAILAVIGRHSHLRQLLDNHWISLFRTENGIPIARYVSGLNWLTVAEDVSKVAA